MGRPARFWKRKQNGYFYATIDGKQTKLSADRAEAERLFHELLAAPREEERKEKRTAAGLTVARICDLFLDESQRTKGEKTYENQKRYLQSFVDAVGKRKRVRDLKVADATEWIATQTGWGPSTRTAAKATLLACLNWAEEQGLIGHNPIRRLKRGTYSRRERILTPQEKEKIAGAVRGPLAGFLRFLELTGTRPFSETARVTAEMIDWAEGHDHLSETQEPLQGEAPHCVLVSGGSGVVAATR